MKRRVQEIEAFWQQKMAEVDPEWLFLLGGMALALALFLLLFGEVYPAVLTGGSVVLYTAVTFWAWDRWDRRRADEQLEQWIQRRKHKPRTVLLLIIACHSLFMLAFSVMTFLFLLMHSVGTMTPAVWQTIITAALVGWGLLGAFGIIVSVLPGAGSIYKYLNNNLRPRRDRKERRKVVKTMVVFSVATSIFSGIAGVFFPGEEEVFTYAAVLIFVSRFYIPASTSGLFSFVVLWWDGLSEALKSG